MSWTHERIHLLEPSNLVEPFCHDDLVNWSARLLGDEGPPKGRTRAGRTSGSVRSRDRRSPMRALLIVGVAVTCFGAGAPLPQFRNLASGDSAWLAESARRLADPDAYGVRSQALGPNDPKSNPADLKLSESNAPSANAGSPSIVAAPQPDATVKHALRLASDPAGGAAASCDQMGPIDEANCLEGATAKPVARTSPPTDAKNDSPGGPPSSPATSTPTARQAVPPIAETARHRADAYGHGERAQFSRRGRADFWDRRRDANRAPSGRRDRGPREDAPTAGFWQGLQDQAWLWRHSSNPISTSRPDQRPEDEALGANFWNRPLISHGSGGRNALITDGKRQGSFLPKLSELLPVLLDAAISLNPVCR